MEGELGLEAGEEQGRDSLRVSRPFGGHGMRAASRCGLGDPPGARAGRDQPELCPRGDRGDAVGDRGVLTLTGLFSGFRGALG